MKQKFYSFVAMTLAIFLSPALYGQCTPTSCISSLPSYGGVCDTLFADGRVGVPYSDSESFHITTTCFDAGILDPSQSGTYIKISSIHTFTFAGIPAGLTASTNQASYTAPANGCFGLNGTPTQAGIFEVSANFLANIIVTTSSCFNLLSQPNNPANYALQLVILPDPAFSIPSTNFTACQPAVTLSPTGTTGGTFQGPGVTGNTFNPALAGPGTHTITYVVSAQEGTAIAPATDSSSVTVTVTTINLSSSSTAATCTGGDGSASVSVTGGGTAPFTYLWSNSATTATINNVIANTYTVTVTDASGCTNTETVTVASSSLTVAGTTSTNNASCNLSDGSATATPSNGTGPYTYFWSPGGQTGQTANNLAAGNYTVLITDANGCQGTLSATINNPNSPIASIQGSTPVLCNGGNSGTATVAASGGTSPYTFAWSASGQTTQTATGLAAGVYQATVVDAASCASTTSVTITEPNVLTASTNSTATSDVSCFGLSDGTAGITATGGTVPYTYLWSNNASTIDINGLVAGTYGVTVTDANGCQSSESIVVSQPAALTASAGSNDILCNGETNGTATASATGGISPYSYTWSNSATTATINNLAAGVYNATIVDANGCNAGTNSVTITEPTALSAGITATSPSTVGGFNGAVTLAPAGGTAPYTYLWSNGATIQNLSNITAGTYSVTITDANGCSHSVGATISDPTSVLFSEGSLEVSVFPNPAKEQATLNIEATNALDANIQVINLMGQVMWSIEANSIVNEQYQLDMSRWASGVYMLRIAVGQEAVVYRLVKQ